MTRIRALGVSAVLFTAIGCVSPRSIPARQDGGDAGELGPDAPPDSSHDLVSPGPDVSPDPDVLAATDKPVASDATADAAADRTMDVVAADVIRMDTAGDGPVICPVGQTACPSGCFNLQANDANCGACGTKCAATSRCAAGQCKILDGNSGCQLPADCFSGGTCNRYYRDKDGDTWGDVAVGFCNTATAPAGHAIRGNDCCDLPGGELINPGAGFQMQPHATTVCPGIAAWDFNCNNHVDKSVDFANACLKTTGPTMSTCSAPPSQSSPTPDCGMSFNQITTCVLDQFARCVPTAMSSVPVTCR